MSSCVIGVLGFMSIFVIWAVKICYIELFKKVDEFMERK